MLGFSGRETSKHWFCAVVFSRKLVTIEFAKSYSEIRISLSNPTRQRFNIIATLQSLLAMSLVLYMVIDSASYSLVIISPIIAFLTQLRSPPSIRLGRVLLWRYERLRDGQISPLVPTYWLSFFVLILVEFWVIAAAFNFNLMPSEERPFLLGFVVAAMASIPPCLLYDWQKRKYQSLSIFVPIALSYIAVRFMYLPMFIDAAPPIEGEYPPLANGVLVGGIVSIPLRYLIVFMLIRAYATTLHIAQGVRSFAANQKDAMFQQNVFELPEPIPNMARNSRFHPDAYLPIKKDADVRQLMRVSPVVGIIVMLVWVPTVFLPILFFRFSIKSTLWVYWPLIWVSTAPWWQKDDAGKLTLRQSQGKRAEDFLPLLVSISALAFLGVRLFSPSALTEASAIAELDEMPRYWPIAVTGVDFSQLTRWDSLPLIGSLFSIFALWFTRRLQRFAEDIPEFTPSQTQLRILVIANNVTSFAAVGTVVLGFSTVFWVVYQRCEFPTWVIDFALNFLPPPAFCSDT